MTEPTYKVIRFYQDVNRENEVVLEGLTLEAAQDHCEDPGTRGHDWFDGWTKEDDDGD